jgi:aryl-alcohol dehydrogenase-like predicted oxidoreductase
MQKRRLGRGGPEVSALGLGCMGMSHTYGHADEQESIATIHRALDLGCSFLDTADVYGAGHNEGLVGRALRGRRDGVVLATKCGIVLSPANKIMAVNGKPEYIRAACEASLQRLGVPAIDLYYLHRKDPDVAIEESVGAMAELVREGKVRHLGLSEVSVHTLRRAHAVHPVAALQSEYSLWTRDPEQDVLPWCRELGVCFVAFSPVGRGFLAGAVTHHRFDEKDFRRNVPRFEEENLRHNLPLVEKLRGLAVQKKCTPAQLALAWVLAQGDFITAIPGTRTRHHLEENWGALQVELTPGDLSMIRKIIPQEAVAGERYSPENMARVDRS